MTVQTEVVTRRSASRGPLALGVLSSLLAAAGTACSGATPGAEGAGPAGCATAADCDDGNACTVETCTAGACSSADTVLTAMALLGAGLAGTEAATVAVAPTEGSVIPRTTHVFCPAGPDASNDPPSCLGQLDLPAATDLGFTQTATGGTLRATVPTRFPELVVHVFQAAGSIGGGSLSVSGNRACPGIAQSYADLALEVRITIDQEGALDALVAVDEVALANATAECLTGNVAPQVQNLLMEAGRTLVRAHLQAALVGAVERQLCAGPPCPAGFGESGGLCRRGGLPDEACLARPADPATRLLEPAACLP